MTRLSRRDWLAATPAALGAGLAVAATATAPAPARAADRTAGEPFGYCLNTSTISGQKLPIAEVVAIAARAGYQGIEPWIRELEQHVQGGGSLEDLGKRIRDHGLSVESAIGFPEWVVDDEGRRRKGLDQARREMAMVRAIGGTRIAAPAAGATDRADLDPRRIAGRYRALLEIGDAIGVVPEVEVWGFSKTLGTLAEAAFVAIAADHPRACVLPDVFHLHKGGSGFRGIRLLNPAAIGIFHVNDYPDLPLDKVTDADRVYPGDGVAPFKELLRDLGAIGYRGMLSLEVFNRDYWKQDALTVARTGLEKLRAVVRGAGLGQHP